MVVEFGPPSRWTSATKDASAPAKGIEILGKVDRSGYEVRTKGKVSIQVVLAFQADLCLFETHSLSSNPDVTLDLVSGAPHALVCFQCMEEGWVDWTQESEAKTNRNERNWRVVDAVLGTHLLKHRHTRSNRCTQNAKTIIYHFVSGASHALVMT